MWRADLRDPDRQTWVLVGERARCSRVVEMDVREQEVANALQVDAETAQPRMQRSERG